MFQWFKRINMRSQSHTPSLEDQKPEGKFLKAQNDSMGSGPYHCMIGDLQVHPPKNLGIFCYIVTNPRIPSRQQVDYTWLAMLAMMKPSLFHQFMLENRGSMVPGHWNPTSSGQNLQGRDNELLNFHRKNEVFPKNS